MDVRCERGVRAVGWGGRQRPRKLLWRIGLAGIYEVSLGLSGGPDGL